jgi:hypothetical protein
MAKKAAPAKRFEKRSGSWPIDLVTAAAAGRTDGGLGLQHLLEEAGFGKKPAMSIIVKRASRRTDRGRPVDPAVDDVLDALRALCA